jgi:hypothetical protein
MTNEEHSGLILAITRVLYVNGQATDQVVLAGRRLGDKFGLEAELLPRWGELQLRQAGRGVTSISNGGGIGCSSTSTCQSSASSV